ncbi:MAG: hypothetical protein B7Y03_06945 [Polaromonas sp. 24-62-144]|nr:MAG: hypothetical protein B7Y03_06945 [Polaromonas sp. 24-62-144]
MHIDANPVGAVGGFRVLSIEFHQTITQRAGPVFEKDDPLRIPAPLKNSLVHPINQGLLVRALDDLCFSVSRRQAGFAREPVSDGRRNPRSFILDVFHSSKGWFPGEHHAPD